MDQTPDSWKPRARVTAISVEQSSCLAILRRPQVDGDQLPDGPGFGLRMVARFGLNPALARRARTEIGNVWVVPGIGVIALELAASDAPSSLGGGGMACSRTDHVAVKGIVTWTSTRSGDQSIVHGLVRDGVDEVVLAASNGATKTVSVKDNVYGTVMDGFFTSLHFVGPSGTVELGPWG
jgi:hypothetical protein